MSKSWYQLRHSSKIDPPWGAKRVSLDPLKNVQILHPTLRIGPQGPPEPKRLQIWSLPNVWAICTGDVLGSARTPCGPDAPSWKPAWDCQYYQNGKNGFKMDLLRDLLKWLQNRSNNGPKKGPTSGPKTGCERDPKMNPTWIQKWIQNGFKNNSILLVS